MTYYVAGRISDGGLVLTDVSNPTELSNAWLADSEGKIQDMTKLPNPFWIAHVLKWMNEDVDMYESPLTELV